MKAESTITLRDRWVHFLCRLGLNRDSFRVKPGLYSLGSPDKDSPVFASANYRLSFNALRSAFSGRSCYILVLDTKGINVWCAAGKGTFGTAEMVRQIEETGLAQVVSHRKIIVPQLGGPGVSAHQVKEQSGFRVKYGPVRAADIPRFLKEGKVSPAMRRITFNFMERLVLIPVELNQALLPMLLAALGLYLLGSPMGAWAVVASVLAGVVLFPLLLPWIPTPDFSTRGAFLGIATALPFAMHAYFQRSSMHPAWAVIAALSYLFLMPPVTAFLALNFTGCTPFASKSGVKREMTAYIPWMTIFFTLGVLLFLAALLTKH
jgi:hypothetical protein